jgi:hypothetical protein
VGLRSATAAVLDRIFTTGRVTRAELASRTGISRPTNSESVRLTAAGVLRDSGSDATGRRGRVATFYEVAPDAGYVLAAALRDTVREPVAATVAHGPPRAVAVSVANPVDPVTKEVIALPDSPFPEGRVPAREILAQGSVAGTPLLVDNDVDLSALAERRAGLASSAESFVSCACWTGPPGVTPVRVRRCGGWAGRGDRCRGWRAGCRVRRTGCGEPGAANRGKRHPGELVSSSAG